MNIELLKTLGQIAGIGGIATGVLLIIFREVIRKKIFPTLTKQQSFRLLRTIVFATWTVAIAGIVAWAWIETTGSQSGLQDEEPDELFCAKLCTAETEDKIFYYRTLLAAEPWETIDVSSIIAGLSPILQLLQTDRRYERCCPEIMASFFRVLGCAHLVKEEHSPFSDKLRVAIPYLKKSLAISPEQKDLAQATEFFESALRENGVSTLEYPAVLFGLLGRDAEEASAVTNYINSLSKDPVYKAQTWMIHEATVTSVMDFLLWHQLGAKEEIGEDWEIEVSSERLNDDEILVQATLGPSVFRWRVDYQDRKYNPVDFYTLECMENLEPTEGAENLARYWFLHKATETPMIYLIKYRLNEFKEQTGEEPSFRIETVSLDQDYIRCNVSYGPNLLSWDIDYDKKKFYSANQITFAVMKSAAAALGNTDNYLGLSPLVDEGGN